jgi:DeoR/GlpR family transcriptional regulator of sugar metabolism
MLPYERYELITTALRAERFVRIEDLLRITGSSLTTLRRDIEHLAGSGRITKSRGGILLADTDESGDASFAYRDREKLNRAEKDRIGLAAQAFINDGDIVFLLNGTTTLSVARHLDPARQLTVITNGIDIVSALRNKPNLEVILLGGVVDYSYNTMTGPMVLKSLGDVHATKLISGAGGINEENGVTIYPYLVSAYYEAIVSMVSEVIIVADRSKLGRNALVRATTLHQVDVIITGSEVPPEYLALFEKHQIQCVQV